MERNDKYAIMFSALCIGPAISEILHVALGQPWPGFTALPSHAASLLVAAVLLASGVAILLRRRSGRWATAGWLADFAAPLACLLHGVVVMGVGTSDLGGAIYLALGAAMVGLGKRTWNGEMVRLRAA